MSTATRAEAILEEASERAYAKIGDTYGGHDYLAASGLPQRLADAEEAMRTALALVRTVLADEETGERPDGTRGWGPDVTMIPVLRKARDVLLATLEEGETT